MKTKEKLVKLNEKQVELLKEAIENQKFIDRLKITKAHSLAKEQAIVRIYEYENLEKKLN